MKIRLSIAVVLTALVAGCGGGGDDSKPAASGGAALFTDNCANCHKLAAAGAQGRVGPDLDQLRPGPDLVNSQVTKGGGGMPAFADKLSAEQIQELSTYVADNAGKS